MVSPKSNHGSHRYRPDIDGLRAVAVIAVVLYHAGIKQFSGGFVGVDVFFVISGYLITQFIDQRIATRMFSVAEFYERRVRRIMPALVFLLLATSVAGAFMLLPQDLVRFAKSQIATVCFAPNIFFLSQSGYFATGAKLKPLLHMWSLGVEEQFYIFFPLLMFIADRWGRRGRLAVVCLGFAGSFAASLWMVQVRGYSQRAFFLTPFRAWELLIGAGLALGFFPVLKSARTRNILAAAGLGAILVGIIAYSSATSFPGLSAALPCFGTALVIYAHEPGATFVGTILSLRPMVAIGLISYSLYLWHWPVLVYAEQLTGHPLTALQTSLAVLSSLGAAALSWKFVERPFRSASSGIPRRTLFIEAATSAVVLVTVSLLCLGVRGLPNRFPQQAIAYASATNNDTADLDLCRTPKQIEKQSRCHFGSGNAPPTFLVWGDSHASALAPAFAVLAGDTGSSGWIATHSGCLPLLDVQRVKTPGCAEFNAEVSALIERKDIRSVVLVGRWAAAALGLTDGELDNGQPQMFLFDSSSKSRSFEENAKVLDRGLRRVLSRLALQNRRIILVMDVPNTGVNTPEYLARSVTQGKIAGDHRDTRILMSTYSRESEQVEEALVRLAGEFKVIAVDPKDDLCKGSQCLIARDGQSLYRDSHHLTKFGALQLVDLFRSLTPRFAAASAQVIDGAGASALPR